MDWVASGLTVLHRYLSFCQRDSTVRKPCSIPIYSPIKYLKAGMAAAPLTAILLNIGKEAP